MSLTLIDAIRKGAKNHCIGEFVALSPPKISLNSIVLDETMADDAFVKHRIVHATAGTIPILARTAPLQHEGDCVPETQLQFRLQ